MPEGLRRRLTSPRSVGYPKTTLDVRTRNLAGLAGIISPFKIPNDPHQHRRPICCDDRLGPPTERGDQTRNDSRDSACCVRTEEELRDAGFSLQSKKEINKQKESDGERESAGDFDRQYDISRRRTQSRKKEHPIDEGSEVDAGALPRGTGHRIEFSCEKYP